MKAQQSESLQLDGHEVKITRPEKVLFPEDGITKGDLVRYYQRAGARMLPYLKDRPLALERYPDGINAGSFFQKSAAKYYPGWISRATVKKVGGTISHVVCNNVATLVYLANQACISLHTWLSRTARLEYPDQMIFDLDPSRAEIGPVIDAAYALKELLDEIALPAFVKTTGSRGLHVTVPLKSKDDFDSVRAFARQVSELVVSQAPARWTLEQRKDKRQGRVFIDINRDAYAQLAVAPYSVRARNGAPVAAPLDWSELRVKGFSPDSITLRNVFERLENLEDPWKDFWHKAVSLEKAQRKLEAIPAVKSVSRETS